MGTDALSRVHTQDYNRNLGNNGDLLSNVNFSNIVEFIEMLTKYDIC